MEPWSTAIWGDAEAIDTTRVFNTQKSCLLAGQLGHAVVVVQGIDAARSLASMP